MRQHRARVSFRIYCGPRSREIAVGQLVDFDERLTDAITLGEAVKGREDCFEPIEAAAAEAEPAAAEDHGA